MNLMGRLVLVFFFLATCIRIGQASNNEALDQLRALIRRQSGGAGGGAGGGGQAGGTISVGANFGGGPGGGGKGNGNGGGQAGGTITVGGNFGGNGGGVGNFGGNGGGGGKGKGVGIGNVGGVGVGKGSGGGSGSGGGRLGGNVNIGINVGGNGGKGGTKGIGGIAGAQNSIGGIFDFPLKIFDSLSGSASKLAEGSLSSYTSPLRTCGNLVDSVAINNSPIVGPISGTVLAGIQAIEKSPTTVHTSLCGGLKEVVDGITGAVSSPMTISGGRTNRHEGIAGALSSPLQLVPTLSGEASESLSGIFEMISSPLTISAHPLDVGVLRSIKSLGNFVPKSLRTSLPGSLSRGTEALIDSPFDLSKYFDEGYDETIDGIGGALSSPLKICAAIGGGKLNLHKDSPLIFPKDSGAPIDSIGGAAVSPLYAVHALFAQSGLALTGILGILSSPLLLSGDLMQEKWHVDTMSGQLPNESELGQPISFHQGVEATIGSPMHLSSTISDSSHLLLDGIAGLMTSPITVLCGHSPIPLPGSARHGIGGIGNSPLELGQLASDNFGYTLAGLMGLLGSPATLSSELLRESINLNPDSLHVLPKQLEEWGFPESIAKTVTSFLEVPFDGLDSVLGLFSSPLAILESLAIANVPGSPNSPPIFPPDFPDKLPGDKLPPYNHQPPCPSPLSGSASDRDHERDAGGGNGPFMGADCDLNEITNLGEYLVCALNRIGITLNGGADNKGLVYTLEKLLDALLIVLGLDPDHPGLLTVVIDLLGVKGTGPVGALLGFLGLSPTKKGLLSPLLGLLGVGKNA